MRGFYHRNQWPPTQGQERRQEQEQEQEQFSAFGLWP